ncbi:hypothetical protein BH23VER1_BH23VER1_30140 [soil metagenome]
MNPTAQSQGAQTAPTAEPIRLAASRPADPGLRRKLLVGTALLAVTGLTLVQVFAQGSDEPAPEPAPATPVADAADVPAEDAAPVADVADADAAGIGDAADMEAAEEPAPDAIEGDSFGAPPAAMEGDSFGGEDFGGEDFGAESFGGEEFGTDAGAALFGAGIEAEAEEEPTETIYLNADEAHIRFLDLLESEKRFPSAATCAQCHPDHYREWSVSAHAYAQVSPVFNSFHATVFQLTSGTNGDFCIRCHTQVGMQREEPVFTSNLKRHPASLEGITCVVCHRVDRNYGKVSGRTAVITGDIFEPVYGPKGNAILQEALNDMSNLKASPDDDGQMKIHGEIEKFDPIAKSGFCGSCHDVNLLNGFRLEEAFTQFKNSPANAAGTTCQDCHMGKIPGAKIAEGEENYLRRPAARVGGTMWAKEGDFDYGSPTQTRRGTNHFFAGPDYSIVHPGMFPHSKEIRDTLWDMQKQKLDESGNIVVEQRANLEHVLDFKWEDGWGDATSAFEKSAAKNPSVEEALPWPWNDRVYRAQFRTLLNDQFRLLNVASAERYQLMRRGIRFGKVELVGHDAKGLKFRVEVRNGTDGHGVPTGFDAERLFFAHTTVRDAHGRVIYESGDRDPNGDVRDLHSSYVHHNAPKEGADLAASDWKIQAGLKKLPSDLYWKEDKDLLNLQSKFITRNLRGGEREQILAVNHSIDPLPYIRPDTTPGILVGRPGAARKQARVLPPNGSRWAPYNVPREALTGALPYTVNVKFIAQMVPVNLVGAIAVVGFDYNLSPLEVAKRVAYGHRVSPSLEDEDRSGGALTIWDKTFVIDGTRTEWDLTPTEEEIMDPGPKEFPYDPMWAGVQSEATGGGGIELEIPAEPIVEPDLPNPELPELPGEDMPLFPEEDFSTDASSRENKQTSL